MRVNTVRLHPIMVGIQQPVLLLVTVGPWIEKRDIHNVHDSRVAAVFVLPLVFGNLFVRPGADWPYPAGDAL